MSLGRLLRRASSRASDLLTLGPGGGGPPSLLDGEILFSKNNVCVHPPEGLRGLGEHYPGKRGTMGGEGRGGGQAWREFSGALVPVPTVLAFALRSPGQ